ncbi:gamma-glutamyl-gamma-aminobutyrate hydrolase family protein [Bailinhaonella thermotolerans]|uniref:Gamma-glutamyl-gamma-aminobutyrate hydrolase family protein n=1 Tax=Bailinhaonella thermotolerans TaxID=1070861 RepID=A0A3A4AY23_9ACTN|nr:gamma-glutamyl-gamma-aminobutyrate hydrolase family protein [Bailinhaonella thermotolerans]RJL32396.1 gamma-glutamyl-gamma-aminobutyrate hydrolase family protein [Bailinhaonella thermotolerans]
MSAPVIGITCYVEPASFTVWNTTAALLPHAYVEHVARTGAQPVLLPPIADPAAVLPRLDALIVAGGGDIDPARYGAPRHPAASHIHGFRDEAELSLVRAALDAGLPFLGVCRGLQILNVALGGTLHQHLPDVVGHTGHSPAPGAYGRLPVQVTPGTLLAKALGTTELTPHHYHHQAIDRPGPGLTLTAHAEDGTVEAAELDSHPFALAVQWHPEMTEDTSLFQALTDATHPRRP